MNNYLLPRFTQCDKGNTPREVIHPSEGIEWEYEKEDRGWPRYRRPSIHP